MPSFRPIFRDPDGSIRSIADGIAPVANSEPGISTPVFRNPDGSIRSVADGIARPHLANDLSPAAIERRVAAAIKEARGKSPSSFLKHVVDVRVVPGKIVLMGGNGANFFGIQQEARKVLAQLLAQSGLKIETRLSPLA